MRTHDVGGSLTGEGSQPFGSPGGVACEGFAAKLVGGTCEGVVAWSPPARRYLDAALSGSVYEATTSKGEKEDMKR